VALWNGKGDMMSSVIPFNKPKDSEVVCDFCKKPKSKVRAMVQRDPTHGICDECCTHAAKRLMEEGYVNEPNATIS